MTPDMRKIGIVIPMLLFFTTVLAVIELETLSVEVWMLFMAGLVFAIYYCGFAGGAIYTSLTGIFGLAYSYYLMRVSETSFDEFYIFFFGFLLQIVLMILVTLFMGTRLSEVLREKERLKKLMLVDHLTGLRNYGYFIDRLREEREKADREDSELCLLMIDIDRFKDFNDRFGHQQGNVVLERIAQTIQNNIRAADIVCRYGGEEFAVILPRTRPEVAFDIANRIRKAVEKMVFYGDRAHPKVKKTVSIGIACYPMQALDEFELIDMADRALYYAKEKGRNTVALYSTDVEKFWFKAYV